MSEIDANEVRASLKTVAEGQQKVELALGRLQEQMKPQSKQIDNLNRTMFGNGGPGVKIDVALLKSQQREMKKSSDKLLFRMWGLIGTVTAAIIGGVVAWVTKQ